MVFMSIIKHKYINRTTKKKLPKKNGNQISIVHMCFVMHAVYTTCIIYTCACVPVCVGVCLYVCNE